VATKIDPKDHVILACLAAKLSLATIVVGTGLSRATVLRRVKAIRERVAACRQAG
jgi:heme exporter protein D